MVNKKGITPIIAVILLMMMTVAAAGAAYFWIIGVQDTIQRDTSDFVSDTLERQDFEIQNVDCNSTSGNITALVYNSGKTKFTSAATRIFLLNISDGTTKNQSVAPDTTLERTQTKLLWPNSAMGTTAGTEYTIKIAIGSTTKEESCKGAA